MLLLAGTAVIAVMDALAKAMSASYGTLQLVWGRYITQAILLFLVIAPHRSHLHLRTQRLSLHLFRVGALLCANVIFFAALATMSLADANAIFFSSPLLITLFAAMLLGEAVGWRRWLAVGAGFAGVLIVMRPGAGTLAWTMVLPFLAAVCSALYHITTPIMARSEDPANTLYFLALFASVGLSLVVPFYWTPLTLPGLLGLLTIGTLGTVGHFLLIRAFQSTSAATLSPFLYIYLIWAVILGWFIFGDIPPITTIVGALIILGSGLYVYRLHGPVTTMAAGEPGDIATDPRRPSP